MIFMNQVITSKFTLSMNLLRKMTEEADVLEIEFVSYKQYSELDGCV